MSPINPTSRPAYKVEELLALRGSASESRVSLEKFPDEDVIKGNYYPPSHFVPADKIADTQYTLWLQAKIGEVERAQLMFRMTGRADVNDPKFVEHVIKKTPSGEHITVSIENLRPPPTATDGPIHGSLAMAQTYRARQAPAGAAVSSTVKRPSPTPSIKRSKAERLLKEHGSPPHVRVTAGGRIVPNDLPQLGSPRLPFTPVFRSNGPNRIPLALPNGSSNGQQLPNGFLGYNGYGKLIQWFDGRWHEVRSDLYGQPMYQMTPPNIPFPSANSVLQYGPGPMHPPAPLPHLVQQPYSYQSPAISTVTLEDIDSKIAVSRAEYERVRQEKIELERHEVKTSDQMSAAQRSQIIAEKRKYVLMLDTIRKKIKELETMKNGGTSNSLSNGNGSSSNGGTGVSSFPTPVYNIGGIDGAIGAIPGQNWPLQPAGFINMPWSTFPSENAATAAPKVESTLATQQEQPEHAIESPVSEPSPSSRALPRRSHAVQIRDPNDINLRRTLSTSGEQHSNLNPASPSYEPGKPYPLTEGSPPHFVVPAPTPIETPNPPPAELAKHWVFSQQVQSNHEQELGYLRSATQRAEEIATLGASQNGYNGTENNGYVAVNRSSNDDNAERSSQRPTSHSSVTTTDFFPVNTHEHSFGKYMSRKTSTAARLSMEANPCTPMREQHSGVVSPMTDQYHPPAPPVSPAGMYGVPPHLLASSPEDMRLSSFLRDTACAQAPPNEQEIPHHSPVRPATRDEFHGKSKSYLEGYLAGSSGHAPADPKNQEYCTGYIDGLSKMCLSSVITRESSTVSLKSETFSVSRTPPNTTENRSLIAELAGTQAARAENIRLTQSLNFSSSPSSSNYPSQEPLDCGGSTHLPGNSLPPDHAKSRVVSGFNLPHQLHLPRAWSEDNSGVSPPKSSFHTSSGPWNVPSHQPKMVNNNISIAPSQAAIISSASPSTPYKVNRRSDRMVSTSLTSQPSLTGYSGNQPGARVGSVPQHSIFGDDKYVITTTAATIEVSKTATLRPALHENQPSVSTTVSRGSQFDGAMDDLREMASPLPPTTSQGPAKHPKNASSKTTGYSKGTPRPNTSAAATPPASPSKSGSSPKKITSPRHRMQQIREKVGDFLDRGSHCGGSGGERSGDASRAESPDPKHMGPEEKKRWKDGWRTKLHAAKAKEDFEVRRWRKEQQQGQGQQ